MSKTSQVKLRKSLFEIRASFVYKWLTDLKTKAEQKKAAVFYEGHKVELHHLIVEPDYCAVKYADNCNCTLFRLPDSDELLYSTLPELKEWLKDSFKLYKEIRV